MVESRKSRIGATCAIAGSVLFFLGTYLHPMEADPNDTSAAFAEYASDRLWVAGLGIVGGVPTTIAGVVMAYTGFSGLTMAINMPASFILLVWMLSVGGCMCHEAESRSNETAV